MLNRLFIGILVAVVGACDFPWGDDDSRRSSGGPKNPTNDQNYDDGDASWSSQFDADCESFCDRGEACIPSGFSAACALNCKDSGIWEACAVNFSAFVECFEESTCQQISVGTRCASEATDVDEECSVAIGGDFYDYYESYVID